MLLSPPYQENLVALAVDEVHCIKSWGDQFRKSIYVASYQEVSRF